MASHCGKQHHLLWITVVLLLLALLAGLATSVESAAAPLTSSRLQQHLHAFQHRAQRLGVKCASPSCDSISVSRHATSGEGREKRRAASTRSDAAHPWNHARYVILSRTSTASDSVEHSFPQDSAERSAAGVSAFLTTRKESEVNRSTSSVSGRDTLFRFLFPSTRGNGRLGVQLAADMDTPCEVREAHVVDHNHIMTFASDSQLECLARFFRTTSLTAHVEDVRLLPVFDTADTYTLKLSSLLLCSIAPTPGLCHTEGLTGSALCNYQNQSEWALLNVQVAVGTGWTVLGDWRASPRIPSGSVRPIDVAEDAGSLFVEVDACKASAVLPVLAAHPAVRWIESSPRVAHTSNNVASSVIQGGEVDPLLATAAMTHPFWQAGLTGTDEVIAVADSGLDIDSCFFRDPSVPVSFYPQVNMQHRKVVSYRQCDGVKSSTVLDVAEGHGTHVSGTAAGSSLGGKSNAAYDGVARDAKLFVRDLGCLGKPTLLQVPADIRGVFTPAYDSGARVSTNSWGMGPATEYTALERVIDSYVFDREDYLLVFASGNSGKNKVDQPGVAKNVLTVGAHQNDKTLPGLNVVPMFSSYGVLYDGRQKPDLVGPGGTTVYSARSDGTTMSNQCTVAGKSGTSMATAAVAGAAALARQFMRECLQLPSPSAALLRAALSHATEPLSNKVQAGFGRLNLTSLFHPSALELCSASRHRSRVDADAVMSSGNFWLTDRQLLRDREEHVMCFSLQDPPGTAEGSDSGSPTVPERGVFTATLAWSDTGGAVEGSIRSLVHDLDLRVVSSDGVVYGPGGPSPPAESDSVSSIEQVRVGVTSSLAAQVRVAVYGESVLFSADGQSYSLVVSGPGLLRHENCTTHTQALASRSDPVSVRCPNDCSGHGVCDAETAMCACDTGFRSLDCSLCDDDVVCNRQGTCALSNVSGALVATCACFPGGHFADAHCSVCLPGWYGPACDFDCKCLNGGVCDAARGTCACPQGRSTADADNITLGNCFSGSHCQYCCEGWTGAACDQRSYWCDLNGQVVIAEEGSAFIQINGYDAYPYSAVCAWVVEAPAPFRISLTYERFNTEAEYDTLLIYDGVPIDGDLTKLRLLRSDSGKLSPPLPRLTSESQSLSLLFTSDYMVPGEGFLLHYHWAGPSFIQVTDPCSPTSMTCMSPLHHAACGAALGLPQWCLCQPPLVSWNCSSVLATPADSLFFSATTATFSVSDGQAGAPLTPVLSNSAGLWVPTTLNGLSHLCLTFDVAAGSHAQSDVDGGIIVRIEFTSALVPLPSAHTVSSPRDRVCSHLSAMLAALREPFVTASTAPEVVGSSTVELVPQHYGPRSGRPEFVAYKFGWVFSVPFAATQSSPDRVVLEQHAIVGVLFNSSATLSSASAPTDEDGSACRLPSSLDWMVSAVTVQSVTGTALAARSALERIAGQNNFVGSVFAVMEPVSSDGGACGATTSRTTSDVLAEILFWGLPVLALAAGLAFGLAWGRWRPATALSDVANGYELEDIVMEHSTPAHSLTGGAAAAAHWHDDEESTAKKTDTDATAVQPRRVGQDNSDCRDVLVAAAAQEALDETENMDNLHNVNSPRNSRE